MSLLSPWFLAGLFLIAGPIVAHLIRRATRDRVTFSAVRFLSPSTPKLDRRSRIQHPLLLLLRCLIVALLALAFARPYWNQTTPPTAAENDSRLVVALVDRSASMRSPGRWENAIEQVEAMVEELAPSDRFELLVFDDGSETLISAEQWERTLPNERAGLVTAALDAQSPTWQATYVDNAVARALETVREFNEIQAGGAGAELIIVSDLASGSRLAGLASLDWPDRTVVKLVTVEAGEASDGFTLQWLGWGADQGRGAPARVRISGPPPATPQSLALQLSDADTGEPWQEPIEIVMPTTGTQLVALPISNDAPESLRIALGDDPDGLGRSLYVVRNLTRELQFQVWGDADTTDTSKAGFYLQSAVAGWRDPAVIPADEATDETPSLQIVTAGISGAEISQLQQQLDRGAFVLVLADSVALADVAAELAGETGWSSRVYEPSQPLLFGEIDFAHPLFASFADPRFSDFTRIRFSKTIDLALPTDSAAHVVARFDNQQPAVIETPVGEGRLIVWTSSWSPRDNPWVLSTKFVPWLQSLAERATGGTAPLAVTDLSNRDRLDLAPDTVVPDTPGVHSVTGSNGKPRSVALNIPPGEIQSEVLSWDAFEDLGVPLANRTTAPVARTGDSQLRPESGLVSESRQRAWRWLILVAVGLLVIEGLLALYFNRRSGTEAVPAAPSN
ncbi:MAG: BatA domain-containing protein [Synoicihabitans sp.]